jgi:hypothetical protein
MTATVLLQFKVVACPVVAAEFAVVIAVMFLVLWFLMPLRIRRNGNGDS